MATLSLDIKHWALTLFVINTVLFCFMNHFRVGVEPKAKRFWSKTFFYSAYFAQAITWSALLTVLMFFIAMCSQHPRIFIPICSFFSMVVMLFTYCCSLVYARYRFNIDSNIVRLVFGKGGSEVVQVHPSEYFIFALAIITVLGLCVTEQLLVWYFSLHYLTYDMLYPVLYAFLIIYFFNQFFYIYLVWRGKIAILQFTVKIYLYDLFSIKRLLQKCGIHLKNTKNEYIHSFRNSMNCNKDLRYPLHPIRQDAQHKKLNVLMIVIDSWRYDMIDPVVTPNIYRYSQNFINFNDHWSGGNTTQPGIFSLFYGIPATYWNAAKRQNIPAAMIKTFCDNDYSLGIYGSATLINPPFDQTVFSCVNNLNKFSAGGNPLERDKSITESMCTFLKNQTPERPFFGFMFYDSSHGYFAIPDLPKHFSPTRYVNHIMMNNNTDPEPIFNLYKCALHEIDLLVGQVLETLETENLLDSTMVFLTSDHGQEFNDLGKNYWEHPSNFSRMQTKVPLLLHHPNRPKETISDFTTHYDISVTIMQEALGVTNPIADYSVGTSLFTSQHVPFVIMTNYTNAGFYNHEYIVDIQRDGHYQVADQDMNYLETAQPSTDLLKAVLEEMNRYYEI